VFVAARRGARGGGGGGGGGGAPPGAPGVPPAPVPAGFARYGRRMLMISDVLCVLCMNRAFSSAVMAAVLTLSSVNITLFCDRIMSALPMMKACMRTAPHRRSSKSHSCWYRAQARSTRLCTSKSKVYFTSRMCRVPLAQTAGTVSQGCNLGNHAFCVTTVTPCMYTNRLTWS